MKVEIKRLTVYIYLMMTEDTYQSDEKARDMVKGNKMGDQWRDRCSSSLAINSGIGLHEGR